MSRRRLLIFDFDNTLVDTRGVGVIALNEVETWMRTSGCADKVLQRKRELFRAFEQNLRERGEDNSGAVDIETWRSGLWREAAASAGLTEFINLEMAGQLNATWKASRLNHLKIPQTVAEMLVELRKEYLLCLLTNGNSVVQSEKIERTGAASYFDVVIISGDHPWEKPAPELYGVVAQRFSLDSLADAVMIGDNWDTDMKGGINAGVKALIWIRRPDIDTRQEDEQLLDSVDAYDGACHLTTDVLTVPSFLEKIYS